MSNFFTILKKELLDIARDKKTLFLTLILPILIYPIMFSFMSSSINDLQGDVENEINIYYEGSETSSVATLLKTLENINFVNSDNPEKDLKNGDLQLIIKVPNTFDNNVSTGTFDKFEILMDEESNKSMIASGLVESAFDNYKNQIVSERLAASGLDSSILTPFEIEVKSGISEEGSAYNPASMLMSMIPTLIIILMVSSTVGMASDLGAGEKERFTFEPLLSTSAKRSSLLWGKIISLCTVSFLALITNLVVMIFSMKKFMLDGVMDGGSFKIDLYSILGILVVGVLVLVTLSALQIAISIYARSTKEANSYLAGITMPVMILAFIPYMTDAKSISPKFFHIPITNSICLMKEFLVGIYDVNHIFMVLGWHIFYISLAIFFAKFMFNREEVIFRN